MTDTVVDLFCGAGGTTTGLIQAMEGKPINLFVINHWEVAVETHSRNYPWAEHLCQNIDNISPRSLFRNQGLIKLLCASPECTHRSNTPGSPPPDPERDRGRS